MAWAERYRRRREQRNAEIAAITPEQWLTMRIEASKQDLDPITTACLGVAVPMWIDRMRGWQSEARQETALELGDLIACSQGAAALSDPEARGTARKGELARVFNALAQGVAILAFCPGGITFAGHHWAVT